MPNTFFPNADAATLARLEENEVVRLANNFDWSKTALGPVPEWPEALKAAVRMVLTSTAPMVLLAGEKDGVLIYNSGYAAFAGDRHPHVFGRPVLAALPELADFNADNMRRGFAGESWALVDFPMTLNRQGTMLPVHVNLSYSPVLDDSGRPLAILVNVQETTARVRAEVARHDSELRFRTLADTMPQMVWSTLPDGYHDYYNARWYEFTGTVPGSTDGEGWNGVFHPDDQQRAWGIWRESLSTGAPYQIEYRLRHHNGDYRWVLGQALPMRNDHGDIVRWFGTLTDIHETRLAAEERELVAQELSHRIKNIFSVLSGIVGLSARSYPEMRELSDQLRQRILALGKAHDFIRPHSLASQPVANPSSLHALVSELLSPYRDGGERVRTSGDDAHIDDGAATPLALLFHELATNSAKYGALSQADGFITLAGRAEGERYLMTWKENGGPAIAGQPPAQAGFGSRLVQLSVEGQLRGSMTQHWEADGLRVELIIPKEALSRSNRLTH